MKRLHLSISAVLTACLLLSCSFSTIFVLFNNTNATIRVYNGVKWFVIEPQTSRHFSAGVNDEITFVVEAGSLTWAYNISGIPIPKGFNGLEGAHVSFYLQLETNRSVYITAPKPQFPVSKLPEQPSGFPLIPKRVEAVNGGWRVIGDSK